MLRILPRLETRYNVVFAKWMETSRMSPAVPGDEEAKAPYFRHCDAVIGLPPTYAPVPLIITSTIITTNVGLTAVSRSNSLAGWR